MGRPGKGRAKGGVDLWTSVERPPVVIGRYREGVQGCCPRLRLPARKTRRLCRPRRSYRWEPSRKGRGPAILLKTNRGPVAGRLLHSWGSAGAPYRLTAVKPSGVSCSFLHREIAAFATPVRSV